MKRVWLRGVPGRGEEVINLLKEYGGRPTAFASGHSGESKYIFFIDHLGFIEVLHEDLEFAKVIMDCYERISLPAIQEHWDDGTVLISRNIYRYYDFDFAIFKASEKRVLSFDAYVAITSDNVISTKGLNFLHFENYRPATDEEIEVFVKRLQKVGKFWNPWAKKLEDL